MHSPHANAAAIVALALAAMVLECTRGVTPDDAEAAALNGDYEGAPCVPTPQSSSV
jgi:hypothetical protein